MKAKQDTAAIPQETCLHSIYLCLFRKTYKQKNNDRKICILLKLLECVTFIMFTFLVGKQCVKDVFPDSFVIPSHFSFLFLQQNESGILWWSHCDWK